MITTQQMNLAIVGRYTLGVFRAEVKSFTDSRPVAYPSRRLVFTLADITPLDFVFHNF